MSCSLITCISQASRELAVGTTISGPGSRSRAACINAVRVVNEIGRDLYTVSDNDASSVTLEICAYRNMLPNRMIAIFVTSRIVGDVKKPVLCRCPKRPRMFGPKGGG